MQREQILTEFAARPFRGLLVRMVSGQVYRVKTPESTFGRRHVAFLVEDDLIATVAMEFIEEIRPLRNGAGRRSRPKRGRGKRRS